MLAILSVALLMRLTRRIWRDQRSVLLAGLMAVLSPFLLAFGATAFSDMSLLFFLVLALLLMEEGRFGGAGLALGMRVLVQTAGAAAVAALRDFVRVSAE